MASNNQFRGAPGLLILGFAVVLLVLAAHAFSLRWRQDHPVEFQGENSAQAR